MVGDTHLHVFAVKTEDCGVAGGEPCLGHVMLLRRPLWVWFTVWLHQAAQ